MATDARVAVVETVLARDNEPAGLGIDRGEIALMARHRSLEQIHLADEFGDPAGLRVLVDLGRRADLDQLAVMHDADPAGHGHRLFLVVGDDDEGEAEPLLQRHQFELGLVAQLLVERAERLVEQEHLGRFRERARKRDPLALAARQLMRLAVAELFELHQRQHLGDALLRSRTSSSRPGADRTRHCRRP